MRLKRQYTQNSKMHFCVGWCVWVCLCCNFVCVFGYVCWMLVFDHKMLISCMWKSSIWTWSPHAIVSDAHTNNRFDAHILRFMHLHLFSCTHFVSVRPAAYIHAIGSMFFSWFCTRTIISHCYMPFKNTKKTIFFVLIWAGARVFSNWLPFNIY